MTCCIGTLDWVEAPRRALAVAHDSVVLATVTCLLACSPAQPTVPTPGPNAQQPRASQGPPAPPPWPKPPEPRQDEPDAARAARLDPDWLPRFDPVPGVASQVSVAEEHACALVNSRALCWGLNSSGELGFVDPKPLWHPPRWITDQPVVDVAARAKRTCVVLGSGHVQCWGELRSQIVPFVRPGAEDESSECSACGCPERAAFVPGLTNAVEVVLGAWHGCVRTDDGRVACWGDNRFGQLGLGHTRPMPLPNGALHPVGGISGATKLVASENSTCALLEDGALWCWGLAAHGELGRRLPASCTNHVHSARQPCSATPLRIELAQVSDVVAGSDHFCAVAAGSVFCWGLSDRHQLGSLGSAGCAYAMTHDLCANKRMTQTTGSCAFKPLRVELEERVRQIAGSRNITCAFHEDQLFSCWGMGAQHLGALWNKPWVVRDVEFGGRLHAVLTPEGTVHTMKAQVAAPIETVNAVASLAAGETETRRLQGLEVPVRCPPQELPLPNCPPTMASVSVSEVRANPRRFLNRWAAVRGSATIGPCGLRPLVQPAPPSPLCPQSIVETALPLPHAEQGIVLQGATDDLPLVCHTATCCEVDRGAPIIARGVLRSSGEGSALRFRLERASTCRLP